MMSFVLDKIPDNLHTVEYNFTKRKVFCVFRKKSVDTSWKVKYNIIKVKEMTNKKAHKGGKEDEMEEKDALKTENLALKREVTRLHKVIADLNNHFLSAIHDKSALYVDKTDQPARWF